MTPKSNWATQTKEALASTTPAIPAGMKAVYGTSLEPIIAFYKFKTPKNPSALSRVLAPGETFRGKYDGRFASKAYPDQYTYKVRTSEGLIGLPACKDLHEKLVNVPVGAEVQITFVETMDIPGGKTKHVFLVASDSTISE